MQARFSRPFEALKNSASNSVGLCSVPLLMNESRSYAGEICAMMSDGLKAKNITQEN